MKKIKALFASTLVMSSLFIFPVSINASESTKASSLQETKFNPESYVSSTVKDKALEEFIKMQDMISAKLQIVDGRYKYDYQDIRSIINNFNFETTNKVLGLNYTPESFLAEVLRNIENAKPINESKARRAICGFGSLTP